MTLLPSLIPFLLILSIYAGYLRLSARIMRRSKVLWRHCLTFALVVGLLTVANRALGAGASSLGPFTFIPALVLQVALGGWFFGSRGFTKQGEPLGFRRAAILVLIALCLLLVTGLVFFGVARTMLPTVGRRAG